jgi:hypothetical protein
MESMEHSHIVAMIDSCLERLHAARRLLSTHSRKSAVEDLLEATEARIAQTKKKVRPKISTKRKRRDELTASLFAQHAEDVATTPEPPPQAIALQAAPVADVVSKQAVVAAPRRRLAARQPSTPVPRKKASPPVSALVGHVPAGPVFIPAAQVPQDRPKSRVESTPPRHSESVPLTAELLAQRWIQNAGF